MTLIKITKSVQKTFFANIFNAIFCLIGIKLKVYFFVFYEKKESSGCYKSLTKSERKAICYVKTKMTWKCKNILQWPKYLCIYLIGSLFMYIGFFIINILLIIFFMIIDIPICLLCIITCGIFKDPIAVYKENHLITLILYIWFIISTLLGLPENTEFLNDICCSAVSSFLKTLTKEAITSAIEAGKGVTKQDVFFCASKEFTELYDKYFVHRIHNFSRLAIKQYRDNTTYENNYPPLDKICFDVDLYPESYNELHAKFSNNV